MIPPTQATETCRLETKAKDTKDSETGILQVSSQLYWYEDIFWDRRKKSRTFRLKEKTEKDLTTAFGCGLRKKHFHHFLLSLERSRKRSKRIIVWKLNSRIAECGITWRRVWSLALPVRKIDCQQEFSLQTGYVWATIAWLSRLGPLNCPVLTTKNMEVNSEINGNVYSSHSYCCSLPSSAFQKLFIIYL